VEFSYSFDATPAAAETTVAPLLAAVPGNAVSLSDDEGRTWKWTRHLEHNEPGPDATTAGYPSILQARDGTLHASYTYTLNGKNVRLDAQGRRQRECIKHAHFNEAWVMERAR